MKNLGNADRPGTGQLVQTYLASSWVIVSTVYNNISDIQEVADALDGGSLTGYLKAADINTLAELNAIVGDATLGDSASFATAAQGALADTAIQGPFASQSEAETGTENTKAMTALRVAQAIAVLAAGLQNKYDGTVNPGVTDDVNAGYSVGSYWINTTASPNESFRCTDNSAGTAVWIHTTLTSDELATVAVSGDSDDLTQGSSKLLMTVSERSKLTAIEASATADQTDAEIRTAVEAATDSNVFTDADHTKLNGIETAATADQSNAEIETGYNVQVAAVSAGEKTAGTEVAIRRFSPKDIADMAGTHGGGAMATDALWDAAGDLAVGTGANTGDRLAMGTGLQVLRVNAGATALEWAAAASGDVATDAIWDTAGDLAVGTGANTAAKLILGSALQVLRVNAGATALEYATPASGAVATDAIWDTAGDIAIGTGANTAIKLALGTASQQLRVNAGATALEYFTASGGGLTVEFKTASFTAAAGKKYKIDTTGGAVVVTLPAGTNLDNIVIQDVGHLAGTNPITINPDGAETIDNDTTFIIDQNDGDVDIGYNNGDSNWEVSADGALDVSVKQVVVLAVSDETSDLAVTTPAITFRMPFGLTLTEVRASVTTAPTGAAVQVDINEAGATILSTKLTIDVSEKTSTTAATPAVISDASLADDAEITVDIDVIGSTIAGAGLKVYLIGTEP